jgi:hypothetical protein
MFDCPANRKSCSSLGEAVDPFDGADEQATEISAASAVVTGRSFLTERAEDAEVVLCALCAKPPVQIPRLASLARDDEANGRGRQQIRDVGDSGPSIALIGCVTPTQDFVMALWKENSNTATAPAPTKDAPIMTPPPA